MVNIAVAQAIVPDCHTNLSIGVSLPVPLVKFSLQVRSSEGSAREARKPPFVGEMDEASDPIGVAGEGDMGHNRLACQVGGGGPLCKVLPACSSINLPPVVKGFCPHLKGGTLLHYK